MQYRVNRRDSEEGNLVDRFKKQTLDCDADATDDYTFTQADFTQLVEDLDGAIEANQIQSPVAGTVVRPDTPTEPETFIIKDVSVRQYLDWIRSAMAMIKNPQVSAWIEGMETATTEDGLIEQWIEIASHIPGYRPFLNPAKQMVTGSKFMDQGIYLTQNLSNHTNVADITQKALTSLRDGFRETLLKLIRHFVAGIMENRISSLFRNLPRYQTDYFDLLKSCLPYDSPVHRAIQIKQSKLQLPLINTTSGKVKTWISQNPLASSSIIPLISPPLLSAYISSDSDWKPVSIPRNVFYSTAAAAKHGYIDSVHMAMRNLNRINPLPPVFLQLLGRSENMRSKLDDFSDNSEELQVLLKIWNQHLTVQFHALVPTIKDYTYIKVAYGLPDAVTSLCQHRRLTVEKQHMYSAVQLHVLRELLLDIDETMKRMFTLKIVSDWNTHMNVFELESTVALALGVLMEIEYSEFTKDKTNSKLSMLLGWCYTLFQQCVRCIPKIYPEFKDDLGIITIAKSPEYKEGQDRKRETILPFLIELKQMKKKSEKGIVKLSTTKLSVLDEFFTLWHMAASDPLPYTPYYESVLLARLSDSIETVRALGVPSSSSQSRVAGGGPHGEENIYDLDDDSDEEKTSPMDVENIVLQPLFDFSEDEESEPEMDTEEVKTQTVEEEENEDDDDSSSESDEVSVDVEEEIKKAINAVDVTEVEHTEAPVEEDEDDGEDGESEDVTPEEWAKMVKEDKEKRDKKKKEDDEKIKREVAEEMKNDALAAAAELERGNDTVVEEKKQQPSKRTKKKKKKVVDSDEDSESGEDNAKDVDGIDMKEDKYDAVKKYKKGAKGVNNLVEPLCLLLFSSEEKVDISNLNVINYGYINNKNKGNGALPSLDRRFVHLLNEQVQGLPFYLHTGNLINSDPVQLSSIITSDVAEKLLPGTGVTNHQLVYDLMVGGSLTWFELPMTDFPTFKEVLLAATPDLSVSYWDQDKLFIGQGKFHNPRKLGTNSFFLRGTSNSVGLYFSGVNSSDTEKMFMENLLMEVINQTNLPEMEKIKATRELHMYAESKSTGVKSRELNKSIKDRQSNQAVIPRFGLALVLLGNQIGRNNDTTRAIDKFHFKLENVNHVSGLIFLCSSIKKLRALADPEVQKKIEFFGGWIDGKIDYLTKLWASDPPNATFDEILELYKIGILLRKWSFCVHAVLREAESALRLFLGVLSSPEENKVAIHKANLYWGGYWDEMFITRLRTAVRYLELDKSEQASTFPSSEAEMDQTTPYDNIHKIYTPTEEEANTVQVPPISADDSYIVETYIESYRTYMGFDADVLSNRAYALTPTTFTVDYGFCSGSVYSSYESYANATDSLTVMPRKLAVYNQSDELKEPEYLKVFNTGYDNFTRKLVQLKKAEHFFSSLLESLKKPIDEAIQSSWVNTDHLVVTLVSIDQCFYRVRVYLIRLFRKWTHIYNYVNKQASGSINNTQVKTWTGVLLAHLSECDRTFKLATVILIPRFLQDIPLIQFSSEELTLSVVNEIFREKFEKYDKNSTKRWIIPFKTLYVFASVFHPDNVGIVEKLKTNLIDEWEEKELEEKEPIKRKPKQEKTVSNKRLKSTTSVPEKKPTTVKSEEKSILPWFESDVKLAKETHDEFDTVGPEVDPSVIEAENKLKRENYTSALKRLAVVDRVRLQNIEMTKLEEYLDLYDFVSDASNMAELKELGYVMPKFNYLNTQETGDWDLFIRTNKIVTDALILGTQEHLDGFKAQKLIADMRIVYGLFNDVFESEIEIRHSKHKPTEVITNKEKDERRKIVNDFEEEIEDIFTLLVGPVGYPDDINGVLIDWVLNHRDQILKVSSYSEQIDKAVESLLIVIWNYTMYTQLKFTIETDEKKNNDEFEEKLKCLLVTEQTLDITSTQKWWFFFNETTVTLGDFIEEFQRLNKTLVTVRTLTGYMDKDNFHSSFNQLTRNMEDVTKYEKLLELMGGYAQKYIRFHEKKLIKRDRALKYFMEKLLEESYPNQRLDQRDVFVQIRNEMKDIVTLEKRDLGSDLSMARLKTAYLILYIEFDPSIKQYQIQHYGYVNSLTESIQGGIVQKYRTEKKKKSK